MRAVFACMMLAAISAVAADTDPFVGTWKMVREKSHDNWGQGPPEALVRTYTSESSGGLRMKTETMRDGKTTFSDFMSASGKAQPTSGTGVFTQKSGAAQYISKRVGPRRIETTYLNRDGKIVGTSATEISSDGRTMTTTLTGTSMDGKPLKNTVVYAKQ